MQTLKSVNLGYPSLNFLLNYIKIFKIPRYLFFLKKKIIKLFKDPDMGIFVNFVKF
jgi:hypothetical protein